MGSLKRNPKKLQRKLVKLKDEASPGEPKFRAFLDDLRTRLREMSPQNIQHQTWTMDSEKENPEKIQRKSVKLNIETCPRKRKFCVLPNVLRT